MKFLFSMLALVAMVCNLKAQTKTINLYELIKSASPDSSSTVNFNGWQKGIVLNPTVKWEQKVPRRVEFTGPKKGQVSYTYFKDGSAKVLLPNKKLDDVSITLEGKSSQGYSEVQIETSMIEDYNLEKLLGNKNCSITFLKKEFEGNPHLHYRVKFPGKKDVWIMLMPLSYSGSLNPSEEEPNLSIIILFDYGEYQTRSS